VIEARPVMGCGGGWPAASIQHTWLLHLHVYQGGGGGIKMKGVA
jgi:hypothetical protein